VHIYHRFSIICTYNRAALDMCALVTGGFVPVEARKSGDSLSSHGFSDFDGLPGHEIDHPALVFTPIECQAQQRVAETVLVNRVQIHVIAAISPMFAVKTDQTGAIVIVDRGFLPFGPPFGFYVRRQDAEAGHGPRSIADRVKRAP